MKNTIIILFIIFTSGLSFSQNTILWKVSDTITNKTSYVLGTFHQFGNSFVDSIPEIKKYLYDSELAIFESIDDLEKLRKTINERESSLEIEKWLKKKDLKNIKEITKEWKVDLYKLKPIEIRWKLQQEFQKIICETTKTTDEWDHFDMYLIYLAEQNGNKTLGLETFESQINAIEQENGNPNWEMERKNISAWIEQLVTEQPNMNNCILANKYRKFDLDYEFQVDCKNGILIEQRNDVWMKIIPNLIKTKNCFIAVGYAHLRNKCGLLEQLKTKGFIIEPIELKASR